jgi:hypothetical protein
MTPLIAKITSQFLEIPPDFHWFEFDVGEEGKTITPDRLQGESISRPLPFPNIALVGYSVDEKVPFAFMVSQKEEQTECTPLFLEKGGLKEYESFGYSVDSSGKLHADYYGKDHTVDSSGELYAVDYYGKYPTPRHAIIKAICYIVLFLDSLEKQPVTAYIPTKRANHAKRIRQGKAPFYDWNTIVIEPPQPKVPPQGGTHASPRWHERRGHWRSIKNNKRVWVRNCQVGNKAKGAVFHDYVVKGTTCTPQD